MSRIRLTRSSYLREDGFNLDCSGRNGRVEVGPDNTAASEPVCAGGFFSRLHAGDCKGITSPNIPS